MIWLVGVSCGCFGCGRSGWLAWISQAVDALFPQFTGAVVDGVEADREMVRFRVRARSSDATCSCCGQRSSRVHARYQRRLADLPIGGRRAEVVVHVRRFKCVNELCPLVTFSEQISGLTTAFVRRTPSLTVALVEVALALAGRPGSLRLPETSSVQASAGSWVRVG